MISLGCQLPAPGSAFSPPASPRHRFASYRYSSGCTGRFTHVSRASARGLPVVRVIPLGDQLGHGLCCVPIKDRWLPVVLVVSYDILTLPLLTRGQPAQKDHQRQHKVNRTPGKPVSCRCRCMCAPDLVQSSMVTCCSTDSCQVSTRCSQ